MVFESALSYFFLRYIENVYSYQKHYVNLREAANRFQVSGFRFIQLAIFQDDYRLCAVART